MRRIDYVVAAFFVCCGIIAMISVHDALLLIVNHEVIHEEERNPLGRWLISMDGGEVWLFVLVKLLGTSVVCATLIRLFAYRRRMAILSASVLAGLQLALLGYLSLG
jgi:hypothetical protein